MDRAVECKICGNSKGNRLHRVPELMFRTDESFDYLECGGCGSLHIVSIPADLARHYPAHYYAFAVTPKPVSLTAWLKSVRARHRFHPTLLGALLQRSFGPEEQPEWIGAVESLLEGPVLDIGCGQGTMLHALERLGFRNVTGVDPHAPDARHPRVKRCGVEDIEGEFSLVMFHHSLEHIPDVFGTLRAARGLLAADGRMIVRIPVAGGFAWRTYGIHWVALDAPRHLWLFSPPAFRHVAASAGLFVERCFFDSTALQFAGSELYRKGKPLSDLTWTPEELSRLSSKARELNEKGDGDAACFVLSKA